MRFVQDKKSFVLIDNPKISDRDINTALAPNVVYDLLHIPHEIYVHTKKGDTQNIHFAVLKPTAKN